jgi:TolA-binding protein
MSGISNISGEDLKAQLSEYHLIVAEVIGGLSADLIETRQKVTELENRIGDLAITIEELQTTTRLLVQASLPRD